MPFTELLLGPLSGIYFSSLILMMLILMLAMTVRLFLSRRKKAYFSLSLSLLVVMAQHMLLILADGSGGTLGYLALLLKAVSFILLNLGIYQLYNASRIRQYVLTYTAIGLAFLLSLLHVVFGGYGGSPEQVLLLQDLGVELYMFLVLFLCHQWITPFVGQWGRYQTGLTLYFIHQLLLVAHRYLFGSDYPLLSAASSCFLILYYASLFLILFERVVELLQATYNRSITDALTGMYNRRFFMGRLEQYLNHGVPVSVIFTDIDNFKKLNDTQGHEKGDEALKKVARILMELSEEVGISGRLGGEEMVVMVTDPDAHAGELAEAIRARVEAEAGVTVSVGYSKAKKGVNADSLVKQADEAMYQAKTTGKNKVCKFTRQKQALVNG
ncbi:diguanylate cyclase [Gorillibacterium sp. sgz5001074]|uniref:GGDEF domain-containing protein n=1 Tax=Gorillibacterium sp. sgz5001074 TaxID=3446695 RepID=UPI003F661C0B